MERRWRSAISLPCIFIGLAILGANLFRYALTLEALSWPTDSGKILSSAVRLDRGDDGDSYVPEISYEYHAYGVHHIAGVRRLAEIPGFSSRREAETIVEKYPEGRAITVYFNPNNPNQAVLEPGKTDWGDAFGAMWFILMGLAPQYRKADEDILAM